MKTTKRPHGITRRLIVYIVLFSSFITLLITAFQLFQEYRDGVSRVEGQIEQIEKLSLPAVTENLWNLYEKQIQTQVEDLVRLPDVRFLEIRSRGEIVASTGTRSSQNVITEIFPLTYLREDESIPIGEMTVVATLEGVYQALYDRILAILISNGTKTALVSVFIFLFFQYLVTKHLLSISDHLRNLSADHLDRKLILDRRPAEDELSQVVTSINEMGDALNRTTVSKNYVDNIIASMGDGLIVVNSDNTIRLVNKSTQELLDYEAKELIGEPVDVIFEGGQESFPARNIENSAQPEDVRALEINGLSRKGKKIPLLVSVSNMGGEDSELPGNIYVLHDITERKTAEEALFAEKERVQVTLSSIGDAVISTDASGRVDFLNPIAESLTGWPAKEAEDQLLTDVFHIINEETRELADDPVARCIKEGRITGLANHTVLVSRSGIEYAIEDSAAPICAKGGELLGVVLVFKDVTTARQLSQKVAYQATHDTLTGLINRGEFERRLQRVLETAQAEYTENAFCYLDLDQFKLVNDTCGHVAGDELLRQLGHLLRQHVRKRDTLARLGGDEFGLLMEHCSLKEAQRIAANIIKVIDDYSFPWKDRSFSIGVSIGLVAVNSESENIDSLLSAADTACYMAKEQGGNSVNLYQYDDEKLARRHGEMRWAVRLPRALAENRFQLYFQEIVPIGGSSHTHIDHFESLLRMEDKMGNLVLPDAFLPAAERYNLSDKLDRWVINRAFKWLQDHPAYLKKLSICCINLSGLSLNNKTFLPFVVQELKSSDISPHKICFEITETVAIANLSSATTFIKALKQLGCHFALDDFGSGLSSFAYLKNLPVDFLKIAGVFVKDILDDPMDLAMVKSINEIGHVMGKQTIAEFVENDAILEKLREIGVDFAQGYGISRPRPMNDLLKS